jgi:glucose-6-phosphate 1-epimerase
MDRPEGVSVRFKAPSPPSDFEHKYKLAYVVTLSRHELSTDVHITNEETDKNFDFQCLLHTYLAVPDIKKIKISGLDKGIAYRDKTRDNKTFEWSGETLIIDAETDR